MLLKRGLQASLTTSSSASDGSSILKIFNSNLSVEEIVMGCSLGNDGHIKENVNGEHLALWNNSNLVAVTLLTLSTIDLLTPESLGHEKIIWADWHGSSAMGNHVLVLTSSGMLRMFNISNGKMEMRMRIKSPDDFSLACATATIQRDVLWVAMENSDVLAVCPIRPFPSLFDYNLDLESEDEYHSQLKSLAVDGIVKKCPLQFMGKIPAVQGPFLIQPEPPGNTFPILMETFSFNGIDFVILGFKNNSLDIYMIEVPIKSSWKTFGNDDVLPVLTLVESIVLEQSFKDIIFAPSHHCLMVHTIQGLIQVNLVWLPKLDKYLSNDDDDQQEESIIPVFVSSIVKIKDESDIDSIKFEDGKLKCLHIDGQVLVIPLSDIHLKKEKVEGAPKPCTLLSNAMESLKIPKIEPITFPNIKLPKLKIPDRFKTCTFPQDVDEDVLEDLLDIVEEWRMKVLIQCSQLGDELSKRIRILCEVGKKQEEWGNSVKVRADALLKESNSNSNDLNKVESQLTKMQFPVMMMTTTEIMQSKQADMIRNRIANLQRTLSDLLIIKKKNPADSQIEDKLQSQSDILERILSQIKSLEIQ